MNNIIGTDGAPLAEVELGDMCRLKGDVNSPLMKVVGAIQGGGLACGWFAPVAGDTPDAQRSVWNCIQVSAGALVKERPQLIN
jgi:hypothetical protein